MYHEDDIKKLNTEECPNSIIIDYTEFNEFLKHTLKHKQADDLNFAILQGSKWLSDNSKEKCATLRLKNVPYTEMLKNIDTKNIGERISTVAMLKNITPIKARMNRAKFECRSCMRLYDLPQRSETITEPAMCQECGGRSFRLLPAQSEFINYRILKLEEPLELRQYGTTREFRAFIEGDIAGPNQNFKPGDVVDIVGNFDVVYEDKNKEWQFVFYLNNVTPLNSTFEDIDISEIDEKEIIELSQKQDIFDLFVNSIAPSVYGREDIKKGVVLQLFEGNKPNENDIDDDRWIIHILVIGDPGLAKSKLLKDVSKLAPKGIFISGTGATEVGLTASAVKDELTGKWAMEAGALVLADSGVLCLDEFDKMSKRTMKSLNEPMEQLTVTSAKAGLVQTMTARTSILAAANPKYSKFDKYKGIKEQINVPESTLSRFDLVYAMEDTIDEDLDKELAIKVLDNEKSMEQIKRIEPELLKKYVAYAKAEIRPILTDAAKDVISDFYVGTRQAALNNPDSKPITLRDLKAIERLSIARAKLELRNYVEIEDAYEAIDIFRNALKTVGLEPETVGAIRGLKSEDEIKKIEKAENLIMEQYETYGFKMPRDAVNDVKGEIKTFCNIEDDEVELLYKEAFGNIKRRLL
jgi:replicative DNA helicase Mcm